MKTLRTSSIQARLIPAIVVLGVLAGCKGDSSTPAATGEDVPSTDAISTDNSNNTDNSNTNTVDENPPLLTENDVDASTGTLRIELTQLTAEARFEEEQFLNLSGASNGTDTLERTESFSIKGCSADDVFYLSNDVRGSTSSQRGYLEVFAGTCIQFDTPWIEPSPVTNVAGIDRWDLFVTTQSNSAPETEQTTAIEPHSDIESVYLVTLPDTGKLTFVQDVRFGEVFAERFFFGVNDDGGRLTDDRVTHFMNFRWSIGVDDCTFSESSLATSCSGLDGL